MVHACVVAGCLSRKLKDCDKSFHSFPFSDPERLIKWVSCISREDTWRPTRHSKICSDHFVLGDFELDTQKRMLRSSALPSLFPATHSSPKKPRRKTPRKLKRPPKRSSEVKVEAHGDSSSASNDEDNKVVPVKCTRVMEDLYPPEEHPFQVKIELDDSYTSNNEDDTVVPVECARPMVDHCLPEEHPLQVKVEFDGDDSSMPNNENDTLVSVESTRTMVDGFPPQESSFQVQADAGTSCKNDEGDTMMHLECSRVKADHSYTIDAETELKNVKQDLETARSIITAQGRTIHYLRQTLERRDATISRMLDDMKVVRLPSSGHHLMGHSFDEDTVSIIRHEVQNFAVTLYLYSVQVYEYVREFVSLPPVSTVRKWALSINCSPGRLSESAELVLERLKKDFDVQRKKACDK